MISFNNAYRGKDVRINGASIVVDWKSLKLTSSDSAQERLAGEKAIKKVLRQQKTTGTMTTSSL